ncbi:MAG: hypothetical protein JO048_15745 [Methylobacteriaceae bacterium]|nr:hypothetical protein [Methylobacteriaceae bacterium]
MIRRTGLIAGAWLAAGAAHGATLDQVTRNGWQLTSLSDDRTGAFTRCEAGSDLQNGARFLISVDRDGRWLTGVAGDVKLRPGQSRPVAFRVDGEPILNGLATAVTPSLVTVPLPNGPEALRALRGAQNLFIDDGRDRMTFAVRRLGPILNGLRECQSRWAALGPTNAKGQAATSTGALAAGNYPIPNATDRRIEAITRGANILSRAKVADFEISPKDLPERLASHEMTWKAKDSVGSLHLVGADGESEEDVPKVRANLVATDVSACNSGRFTAEAVPTGDGKGVALTTLCQGDQGWSQNYLLMPRPMGGVYVLSIVGQAGQAEGLRAQADSLRAVAPQILAQVPEAQTPLGGEQQTQ